MNNGKNYEIRFNIVKTICVFHFNKIPTPKNWKIHQKPTCNSRCSLQLQQNHICYTYGSCSDNHFHFFWKIVLCWHTNYWCQHQEPLKFIENLDVTQDVLSSCNIITHATLMVLVQKIISTFLKRLFFVSTWSHILHLCLLYFSLTNK